MFAKAKKTTTTNDKATSTIIGEGIIIEGGTIKGEGNVRIDGHFKGSIDLNGHIIIGETGHVEGEISSYSALLAGVFVGDIKSQDSVHLASNCDVTGNIDSVKVIMDEDSAFNGNCKMKSQKEKALLSYSVSEEEIV